MAQGGVHGASAGSQRPLAGLGESVHLFIFCFPFFILRSSCCATRQHAQVRAPLYGTYLSKYLRGLIAVAPELFDPSPSPKYAYVLECPGPGPRLFRTGIVFRAIKRAG